MRAALGRVAGIPLKWNPFCDLFVSPIKRGARNLNNTDERAADRAPAAADDISSWPFVDRRKADRRRHDRRSEPPRFDDLGYALEMCTGREREIVGLLLQGMTNKQIAQTLGIAEDTVKKHLHHVYKKLGVRRRALLIVDRAAALRPRRVTTFVE
jgi:DNA-binding CsgD family transcriptional regulator